MSQNLSFIYLYIFKLFCGLRDLFVKPINCFEQDLNVPLSQLDFLPFCIRITDRPLISYFNQILIIITNILRFLTSSYYYIFSYLSQFDTENHIQVDTKFTGLISNRSISRAMVGRVGYTSGTLVWCGQHRQWDGGKARPYSKKTFGGWSAPSGRIFEATRTAFYRKGVYV